ncbi:glycerophosphodiester phosphodiesterase family protein [Sphingobacterium deserti]|uniref:Glycerophosphoryl diester phosphodiesterase n=1 Tax=Sphingobacterium deserti TaxID=1229276 RepID=A0A0B8T4A5_9SPHI|nr:glycerophosphodiester phosphodiesterase family protein [Sphingobacterium deserti]KGE14338.1 glycerophosphoryl diester phosphodiesterase [Sphingobacterium deserti]
MHKGISRFTIVAAMCVAMINLVQAQSNYWDFKCPEDLHAFFSYRKGKHVLSGHRGSTEKGLPENSLAAFSKVLEHTPAFFEIDPRLTKDSVVVLMHDATLDRTSNGSGKVSDYTWAQLQELRLKDRSGKLTDQRIPRLDSVLVWAKGKTVLNLDQKGVPAAVYIELIRKYNAFSYVMITVHTASQAKDFLKMAPQLMLSAHIKTKPVYETYKKQRIPFNQLIAYIGSEFTSENKALCSLLNEKGVMCMISAAPMFDKLPAAARRANAYRTVFKDGASILESDFPMEVSVAVESHGY